MDAGIGGIVTLLDFTEAADGRFDSLNGARLHGYAERDESGVALISLGVADWLLKRTDKQQKRFNRQR